MPLGVFLEAAISALQLKSFPEEKTTGKWFEETHCVASALRLA